MDILSETILSPSFDDFEIWTQRENLYIDEWNKMHSEMFSKILIKTVLDKKNKEFRIFHSDESIQSMLEFLFKNHEHRVIVVDKCKVNDLRYTTIISQTDLLYFFFLNQKSIPQTVLSFKAADLMQLAMPAILKDCSIDMDHVTQKAPIIAPCDTPTLIALRVMKLYHVSSVGIVDPDGALVGNLSPNDFRGYDFQDLSCLVHPVLTFIKLQHQEDPRMWSISCTKDDQLMILIHRMLRAKVHRIWVCDELLHPLGVVTMTDILTALTQIKND
jgi:CBS domain-containing protein